MAVDGPAHLLDSHAPETHDGNRSGLRILVLGNMYPPHALGGYEMSCRDVVDRMRARGHDVAVLTTTMRLPGVDDAPGEREQGIQRDLRFYWDDHRLVTPPPRERWHIERHNQHVLRSALDRHQPQVVSVWNMGAMSLGLLTTLVRSGIPLVYAVCDDWLDYGPNLDPWLRAWRRRPRLAPLAAHLTRVPTGLPADLGESGAFCFVSDHVRQWAKAHTSWRYPLDPVVFSGIDPADFPSTGRRQREWSWRLLYVGRVEPRKGVEDAIRALVHLPASATLRVVGRADPLYREHLDRTLADLGLDQRVDFGVAPRDELAGIYADSDAVLFPPVWEEPFGLVPVESMACGTPVVATATGGSKEFLVDGGNCLVVPKHDPKAIAAAVSRLHDDAALRGRLVEGGRATAAELTVDRLADTFEAWFRSAAAGFRAGRPADRVLP